MLTNRISHPLQAWNTVIVPAYGWRAIANAPRFMGMNVVYCDIDETGNVDLDQLQDLI